jgi:hypothetical protein
MIAQQKKKHKVKATKFFFPKLHVIKIVLKV